MLDLSVGAKSSHERISPSGYRKTPSPVGSASPSCVAGNGSPFHVLAGNDIDPFAAETFSASHADAQLLPGAIDGISACENMEASLSESFGETARAAEQVNSGAPMGGHRAEGLTEGMVSGSCNSRSWYRSKNSTTACRPSHASEM